MTTSPRVDRTYWDVYQELSKLATEADKAVNDHPIGSQEWYKAWGYAEGMRQACIEALNIND
jgi:hypothetical protein